ncbi:MAG: primosomal protein N' [Lachnospiraceae bacterium]|nr:primosomal protein N' [Lachnospiraceae bacterium]
MSEIYADVIVEISHEKLDRTFQYRVPEELHTSVIPGTIVQIPFGKAGKIIKGYVVGLSEETKIPTEKIKDICAVAVSGAEGPKEALVSLAVWMKQHYGGTLVQSLKTVLPVRAPVKQRVLRKVRLNVSIGEAAEKHALFLKKHQVARARLLAALIDEGEIEDSLIRNKLHVTNAVVKALAEQGLVAVDENISYREPPKFKGRREVHSLNCEQRKVYEAFAAEYEAGKREVYLLHGITGSGKTEVYMEMIDRVLSDGKQAILLIPEIALTFQTVMRFNRRFGDRVSYMHSRLSAGERYDQFEKAASGKLDIMIGPRSALFTPFPNLGIIIIDEEHEGSYKAENVPRYHARETAIERAREAGASVVLGSATPSVDACYRARRGEYRLLELKNRALEKASLPEVFVVDLRKELMEGNRSMFSGLLRQKLSERLAAGEQSMIFLNRRGYAGFVSCRKCGFVYRCPHCEVSLSAHRGGRLVCHYCGYETVLSKTCPECGSGYIGGMKAGTEKIERELARFFPGARLLRMDADTTRNRNDYEKILAAFADEKADILVGTQMIVKGHDFPKVTLMGVLAADLSLNVGDYRASERTFQLVTQAAGRAGRGEKAGEVVIQTYQPDNYSIAAAARQDYNEFYAKEIAFREFMGYPPAAHLLKILVESPSEEAGKRAAELCASCVKEVGEGKLIGPGTDIIGKLNDIFRFTVYVKHSDYEVLTRIKDSLEKLRQEGEKAGDPVRTRVSFDFDPQ